MGHCGNHGSWDKKHVHFSLLKLNVIPLQKEKPDKKVFCVMNYMTEKLPSCSLLHFASIYLKNVDKGSYTGIIIMVHWF